jgi:hypothetical protein
MGYDKLAEHYLDRAFPQTRQVTGADLTRMGIDPALHDKAQEIVAQLTRGGIKPTTDQVVSEFKRQQAAERRRGI